MNIVRKIHDQFRVKTVAGAQLETPGAVSSQGAGGSTFITITGGGGTSLSGSGLSEEDRVKLDSIEQGAQVNQDAFSKIQLNATSINGDNQSSSSNSSIVANVPTDTANIKIVGNYPITVNLESVSLFNSNTSTTTGTAITTYNISFDSSNDIVIEYVDGALLNVADVELIQVKHKEDVLATYQLSDITYTTSDGTITSFTIPYSNTDFSEIEFCKYETVTTETEEGSTTVRELRVLSVLPTSPTKQSIITLSSLTDSFWNYEEDANGNKFVWTDYNVYSTKDISAYGRSAGTGGSYASNLYELSDVALTNLSNNDLLIYNSSTSKWVNINKDQLGISADQLHTLTISVNGVTQTTYNPASADASVNISTITLNEVTEYIDQKIDTKLDTSEFFKWFTINYDSSNNVVSIQANFDFYSIGGVSAYGLGDIGGSSRTTLSSLDDVDLSSLATNDMLAYNGSKWVNIPMSQVRGATSWTDLEDKPTTLAQLGITDIYTKTEVDTKATEISSRVDTLYTSKADSSIQIIAGSGLSGGGNLQQDITLSLEELNNSGTYYKVTVDAYGRVTSGSTLSASDIPDLDWSKIISGKPTTLEGYGITDGVNSIVLNGDGNAITEASINNHVLTLVKGATYLQQSTFDDMFEKVNIGTESAPKYAIKAKYGFYSVGEITAYGLNDNGKTTYTTLAELDDVQISNLAIDNLLKYDGSKWVNIPMSQMVVDAYTKSEMDNKLATITDIVEDVQRQTNRQVAFWFFEYDPTTTNYPASEWTTNEEKLKHEEDMFYNSTNGKVWRWKLNSSSQYEWSLITDADTLRALELVEIAQNTANQKKRNFTTTPTKDDVYDVGDLWSNATYGTSYDNDLLVCITAKTAGTNFSISHWQPIGKVTSSYISGQISIINNSVNRLDARVGTAETNISTAQSTANAAKTAAATAQSTADTAKSTANSALTKATTNESTLTTITSGAPSNLNTFKKLASAINNDANYYTTVNNKITSEVSTLNSRIDSEVSTLNGKIDTKVKTLQDQLNTIFSWFAFENSCIKAKYSLFSVGELTAHKTS